MKKNSLVNSKILNSSQETLTDNNQKFLRYLNNSQETLNENSLRPRVVDTSRETLFFKNNKKGNRMSRARDTLYELDIENYIDFYRDEEEEEITSPSELLLKDKYKLFLELENKLSNLSSVYNSNLEEITKMDYVVQAVKENIKNLESDIKDLKIHSDDVNKFSKLKSSNTISRSNTSGSKNSDGFFNRMSGIIRSVSIRKSNTNNSKISKTNSSEGSVNDKHIEELKIKIMNTLYDKKMELEASKEMLKEIQYSGNKLLMANDQYEQEMEHIRKVLIKIQTDIHNLPTSPKSIRFSE